MGSEYLVALKKADLDAVEAMIQDAPMIYKGIVRICGDPTPRGKKLEDYTSAVAAYMSLKKAASICRHPTAIGQQKTVCAKEVKLSQSHLAMARIELDALQKRHRSIVQRISYLKGTLHGPWDVS